MMSVVVVAMTSRYCTAMVVFWNFSAMKYVGRMRSPIMRTSHCVCDVDASSARRLYDPGFDCMYMTKGVIRNTGKSIPLATTAIRSFLEDVFVISIMSSMLHAASSAMPKSKKNTNLPGIFSEVKMWLSMR